MKIDHVTLGQELSQTRRKCLKLTALAGAAYPNNDSFVQILFAQVRALDQLINELDKLYHGEVSDDVFDRLGHPYFPLRDRVHSELDIGISHYRPRTRNRKQRFSKEENVAARRCLIEIGESLAYASGLIIEYGSRHRVKVALKYAKACCETAGFHLGLSPASATDLA